MRPPGVRRFIFPSIYLPHLHSRFRVTFGFSLLGSLAQPRYAWCGSYSSGRNCAADFLQIPPRDGHPCPWLALGRYLPVQGTCTPHMMRHARHTK